MHETVPLCEHPTKDPATPAGPRSVELGGTGYVTPAELRARWRADAAVLHRRGAEGAAVLLESCAAELDAALADGAPEPVTLAEAANLSGYSIPHLRRLIADGALRNVSANGRVRVRPGDLPRKLKRAS